MRVRIFFCLMVLFLFLPTASPAADSPILFSAADSLKQAREDFSAGRYDAVIQRLEALFLAGQGEDAARDLLFHAYEQSVNPLYQRRQFAPAIQRVQKMLTLRPQDRKWAAILHNLYFRAGMNTQGIAYGKTLLENAGNLELDEQDLARVHGRQAMLYASIGEVRRSFEELAKAARLEDGELSRYLAEVIPRRLPLEQARQGLDEAIIDGELKTRLAGLLPGAETKTAPEATPRPETIAAPAAEGTRETVAVSPELVTSRPAAPQTVKEEIIPTVAEGESSPVLLAPRRELYLEFLENGEKSLNAGDATEALRAFERALEVAPPHELKRIDRKRFSAWFQLNRRKLEWGAWGIIAALFLLFLWLTGWLRRRSDYSLVSPSRALARASQLVEKEKWDAVIQELSRLPEGTLKPEELRQMSLNLALAWMAKGNQANAILHARRVLQRDPGNVDAHLILGKVYQKLGDQTQRAMEIYEFLADRNLANLRMLKCLAAWHLRQNSISEKSARVAQDIQRYEPDDVVSAQLIARWYHHNGRYDDEAVAFLQRVGEQLPRDIQIKIYLLEAHFRRKDYHAVVREALTIFPLSVDNIIVHSLFIDAIVRLREPKMLLTEYQRLCLENPGSVIVKYIQQSLHSLLVQQKPYPEADLSLTLKVNFTVCPRCFHLNLTEFNHCQKCRTQLQP